MQSQTTLSAQHRPAGPLHTLLVLGLAALLNACSTPAPQRSALPDRPAASKPSPQSYFQLEHDAQAQEVVLYALGLLDVGYRFGGRNPEAGLDCSGMVSYIVEQVSGRRLPHNAAQIAALTRPIEPGKLAPGDLVFFNTLNRQHSHMGVYMGNGRFIHAPSSRGRIRVERLDNPYFARRLDGARTLVARN